MKNEPSSTLRHRTSPWSRRINRRRYAIAPQECVRRLLELERKMEYFVEPEEAFTRDEIE